MLKRRREKQQAKKKLQRDTENRQRMEGTFNTYPATSGQVFLRTTLVPQYSNHFSHVPPPPPPFFLLCVHTPQFFCTANPDFRLTHQQWQRNKPPLKCKQ